LFNNSSCSAVQLFNLQQYQFRNWINTTLIIVTLVSQYFFNQYVSIINMLSISCGQVLWAVTKNLLIS